MQRGPQAHNNITIKNIKLFYLQITTYLEDMRHSLFKLNMMKPKNQSYNALCKAVLIALLHFQACDTCSVSPGTHSPSERNDQHPDPENNKISIH